MKKQTTEQWLLKRGIILEESFSVALKNFAKVFQAKNEIKNIEEVYSLIGLKKQYLSYWKKNSASLQTKKNFKLNVIYAAAKLFKLSNTERENLANKAGFTLNRDKKFRQHLNLLISQTEQRQKNIYDRALISDRMYRHIKTDYHPTKNSLLALAISLNLSIDQINLLLQKAGYILSNYIAFDMVIKCLLEDTKNKNCTNRLFYINDVLFDLDLPLLMTREKS